VLPVFELKTVKPNPLLHYPFLQGNALDLTLWMDLLQYLNIKHNSIFRTMKILGFSMKNHVSNKQSKSNLLLKHHFLQYIGPLFSSPSAVQLIQTEVIVYHFSSCLEEMKPFPILMINCFCS